jgi:hypothetical protein
MLRIFVFVILHNFSFFITITILDIRSTSILGYIGLIIFVFRFVLKKVRTKNLFRLVLANIQASFYLRSISLDKHFHDLYKHFHSLDKHSHSIQKCFQRVLIEAVRVIVQAVKCF